MIVGGVNGVITAAARARAADDEESDRRLLAGPVERLAPMRAPLKPEP
jgi:hypothetical protein